MKPWVARYEIQVMVPPSKPNESRRLEKRTFEIKDIKSNECPNSLLTLDPEMRELVELQFKAENSGIQLFSSDPNKRPAWSTDFYQIVTGAENKIQSAQADMLARG